MITTSEVWCSHWNLHRKGQSITRNAQILVPKCKLLLMTDVSMSGNGVIGQLLEFRNVCQDTRTNEDRLATTATSSLSPCGVLNAIYRAKLRTKDIHQPQPSITPPEIESTVLVNVHIHLQLHISIMRFTSLLLAPIFAILFANAASIGITGTERRGVADIPSDHELAKRIDIVAKTDEILYKYTIDQFVTALAQKNPPELDWEQTDGCSRAPDNFPTLYNFRSSCKRHDFGYSNYRKQNRLCKNTRNALDQQFKRDMNNHCSKRFPHWYEYFQRRACRLAAETYYLFVAYYYDPSFSQGC
ncbi:hypothetical protein FRC16_000824 [Serendipita sp. 398]|nr:hypothetical protein FRC16_000824 [Serendipita sp. 398]